MSTDQPAPPSIPPRKRPEGAPDLRASMSLPHVVSAGSTPDASASPPPSPRSSAPRSPAPLSPAARAAAAMGTGEPAPAPAPVPVTSTMLKALKNASAAVAGATSAVGEPFRSRAAASPPAGAPPRVDSTKAVPPIATTGTQTTGFGTAGGTASGSAPSSATATGTGTGTATGTTTGTGTTSGTGASSPRPAAVRTESSPGPALNRDGAPRRVRLAISRVDPWSVMKLSFLLSVAIGIMIVVAAAVVWLVLDGLSVFTKVNDMVGEIVGKESSPDILQYVKFSRVVSGATFVAVIDVVLLTALSTIGAFLYNITASLVGGVTLTLTDD